MYIFKAPAPKAGEPLPSNIPMSWGPGIAAAASVLAFAVLPAVHTYVPAIPAMDLTTVQGAIGITLGVALWVHQVGTHAALNYFMVNILPKLEQSLLPRIEQAVQAIVADELAKQNGGVGSLSNGEIQAVKIFRAAQFPASIAAPTVDLAGSTQSLPQRP